MEEYQIKRKEFLKERKDGYKQINNLILKRKIIIWLALISTILMWIGFYFCAKMDGYEYCIALGGLSMCSLYIAIRYKTVPSLVLQEEIIIESLKVFQEKYRRNEAFINPARSEKIHMYNDLLVRDMNLQKNQSLKQIKGFKWSEEFFWKEREFHLGYAITLEMVGISHETKRMVSTRLIAIDRKTTINEFLHININVNKEENESQTALKKKLIERFKEVYKKYNLPFIVIIKDNYLRIYITVFEKSLKQEYEIIFNIHETMKEILEIIDEQELKI